MDSGDEKIYKGVYKLILVVLVIQILVVLLEKMEVLSQKKRADIWIVIISSWNWVAVCTTVKSAAIVMVSV